MPNKPEYHSDSPKTAGPGRRPTLASRASALLVTLLLLTIVTTIVVLMFQAVTIDRRLAADFQKGVQARTISQFALDDALQTLQSALNNLDDPFGATTAATNFWAVAPGRLDLFSLASGNPRPQRITNIALHSGYDTSQELVDLNFTNASTNRAIWPGGPDMPVNWKPVLKDPSSAASATNPIVGRYAFWVDDESSKVNINTADGTELYTTNSYGVGTPSSVRLRAILTTLGTNDIKAIAAAAISNQFSDLSEVGRLNTNYLAAVRSNAFFLTEYSRSPEFNIFNEPRFQLASMWGGNRASNGITGNGTVGTPTNFIPASAGSAPNINTSRLPLDFRLSAYPLIAAFNAQNFPARSIYPTPLQLTSTNRSSFWPYLPTLSCDVPNAATRNAGTLASTNQIIASVGALANGPYTSFNSPERFEAARRLALYLVGTNANNQPVTWPFSQANYATSKYTLRQLDSITVQALDMVSSTVYGLAIQPPLLAPYGILSTDPVIGIGNTAKICEYMFQFTYHAQAVPVGGTIPENPKLQCQFYCKSYAPAHYLNPIWAGIAANPGVEPTGLDTSPNSGQPARVFIQTLDNQCATRTDSTNAFNTVNYPAYGASTPAYPGGASYYANPWVVDPAISSNTNNPYMSYWGDTLLQAVDQSGLCAGVDFNLHQNTLDDPDPRSAMFRKDGKGTYATNTWGGSVWAPSQAWGPGTSYYPGMQLASSGQGVQQSGAFWVVRNGAAGGRLPTRDYYSTNPPTPLVTSGAYATNITSITMRGGINYRVSWASAGILEAVPLSSLMTTARRTGQGFARSLPSTNDVIPFPANVMVNSTTTSMYVHAYAPDPVVNKFPGNWIVTASSSLPSHTLGGLGGGIYQVTNHIGMSNNMASMWGPLPLSLKNTNTSVVSTNPIVATLNLPSVGTLQYIRTKMMPPDDAGNTNRGQPFRCLSFAAASDTTQSGIPDWAMLDLMTVPQAVYDRPGSILTSGATNLINLTYGGATTGKINPNGSALFPWVTNSTTYIRPQPLTAVFTDLRYNLDGTTNFTALTTNLAATLASQVATYIAANGPLSMAGQICDIPTINAYGASANSTRNDIVSQSIGLLETRSSVFSVWVAAQSIAKRPTNTGYGSFETGDSVQSEKRYRFTVERYLDLGVDGVPGNVNSPGPDNVVGTLDDPVDPVYNPANPKYKYRVINAQEIQ